MKKLWNISSWTLGFILIISLFAFSDDCQNDTRIKRVEIEIKGLEEYHFITKEEVAAVIYSEYPFLDSLHCREINKNLLEESLDNHPSIAKAEVYSTLSGILWISISQKRPVFRVQLSERAYYVDATGGVMPLSPHYSAEVPLITGNITPDSHRQLFEFFQSLEEDEFYNEFFHGIDISEDGTWTLFPKIAEHRVMLGEPVDIENKLDRLRTFYLKTGETPLIEEFKSLNLAYDGQVVCSKK